ncbi:hypothetical protein [Kallotenue papyrolyticum]|uniref:hypothetical protein n=1 Tax=Kallotenue papyrolyticum TaxID=1325125 RepID=UPI000478608E|nr:hypothetical protein [Kallotenue papyrolyticum]
MHTDPHQRAQPQPDERAAPLPDVPDAGDATVPMVPPEPVDISTATLNADAGRVASYAGDDDARSLYEQALDDPSASPAADRASAPPDALAPPDSA